MDLITIVSQNIVPLIIGLMAIGGSILTTINVNKKNSIKEALGKQQLLDNVENLGKRMDEAEKSIDNINIVQSSIETKLENIEAQGSQTHSVLLMIQEKFMDSLINK